MGLRIVIHILIGLTVLQSTDAAVKSWRLTWNLDDSANWGGADPNCYTVAELPARLDYTTYLSSSVSYSSLLLPTSGELVFGERGVIRMGGGRGPGCAKEPRTMVWSHFGRDRWWDPLGWSVPRELQEQAVAVPDEHRVPCRADVATLPDPAKYLTPVHFQPPTVTVAALTIAGKNYTTSGITEHATTTASGQLTGWSSAGVFLYAEQDEDCHGDCKCHREQNVMPTVCSSSSAACPATDCDDPVKMTGWCCHACGADITLPRSFIGDKRELMNLLTSLSADIEMRDVSYYVGLMADDAYHVYLLPRTDAGDYSGAANLLKETIKRMLGESVSSDLLMLTAGTSAYQRSQVTSSRAKVVTAVLLVLLFVGAAVVAFVYKRGLHRLDSSANFRFRRMSMVAIRRLSRISLHGDTLSSRRASSASTAVPTYNAQSGLRFMNPVFSKSTASLAAMPIEPEGGGSVDVTSDTLDAEGVTSHENPMYSAYMHMSPDEKKATDYTCSNPTPKGPPKPPRLDDKTEGVVRFSQLGTITEDNQSFEDSCEINSERISIKEDGNSDEEIGDKNSGAYKQDATFSNEVYQRADETKIVIDVNDDDIQDTDAKTEATAEIVSEECSFTPPPIKNERESTSEDDQIDTLWKDSPNTDKVLHDDTLIVTEDIAQINFGFE